MSIRIGHAVSRCQYVCVAVCDNFSRLDVSAPREKVLEPHFAGNTGVLEVVQGRGERPETFRRGGSNSFKRIDRVGKLGTSICHGIYRNKFKSFG